MYWADCPHISGLKEGGWDEQIQGTLTRHLGKLSEEVFQMAYAYLSVKKN